MSKFAVLPLISEKAVAQAEGNTYVFKVSESASKIEIARAVGEKFNVKVKSVNTAKVTGKPKNFRTRSRLISGRRSDIKKAYVTLAEGESIKLFEGSS